MSIKYMSAGYDMALKPAQRDVYMAMADHADHDGKNIYPSLGLIAWKVDMDVRTVRRVVRQLEVIGLLVLEQKGKGRITNKWHIDLGKAPLKKPYAETIESGQFVRSERTQYDPLRPDPAMSAKPSIEPSRKDSDAPAKPDASPVSETLKIEVLETAIAKSESATIPAMVEQTTQIAPKPSISHKPRNTSPLKLEWEVKGLPPPKQTPELKKALAELCEGSDAAWKAPSVAATLAKALRELLELKPSLMPNDLEDFETRWYANDFRGQKNQRPKPHQVVSEWCNIMNPKGKAIAHASSARGPTKGARRLNDAKANDTYYEVYNGATWEREVTQ